MLKIFNVRGENEKIEIKLSLEERNLRSFRFLRENKREMLKICNFREEKAETRKFEVEIQRKQRLEDRKIEKTIYQREKSSKFSILNEKIREIFKVLKKK